MSTDEVNTAVAGSARNGGPERHRDPEDPGKPDSPTKLTKPSWKYIAGKTVREFSDDQCIDLAAALTYYAVLALFPALLALVSLLGLIGQQSTVEQLVGILDQIGAGSVGDTISEPLGAIDSELVGRPRPDHRHRRCAVVRVRLCRGLRPGDEPGLRNRGGASVLEAPTVDDHRHTGSGDPGRHSRHRPGRSPARCPGPSVTQSVWVTRPSRCGTSSNGRCSPPWPRWWWRSFTTRHPTCKQPKFRWISIGAVVAIVTWILASVLFGFYISQFSNYNKTYGSLAGVIIFLLWLWITNLALLFGAELDAEMERGRQLQAGIAAERDFNYPRGTPGSATRRQPRTPRYPTGRTTPAHSGRHRQCRARHLKR